MEQLVDEVERRGILLVDEEDALGRCIAEQPFGDFICFVRNSFLRWNQNSILFLCVNALREENRKQGGKQQRALQ